MRLDYVFLVLGYAAQALTGWPQEDLLDPLAGASLQGGACFDRLEESILGNEEAEVRQKT